MRWRSSSSWATRPASIVLPRTDVVGDEEVGARELEGFSGGVS